eukprot:6205658-Pleurochrysis_carterae.AAC.2
MQSARAAVANERSVSRACDRPRPLARVRLSWSHLREAAHVLRALHAVDADLGRTRRRNGVSALSRAAEARQCAPTRAIAGGRMYACVRVLASVRVHV